MKIKAILFSLVLVLFGCENRSNFSAESLSSTDDSTAPSSEDSSELPTLSMLMSNASYHQSTVESPSFLMTVEGDTGHVARYEICIGTEDGSTDVLDWTDMGTATSFSKDQLSLSNGQQYHIRIRAINFGGEVLSSTKGAWTADAVKPGLVIGLADSADYHENLNETPLIQWSAAVDLHTAVDHYELAIGSTSGATDILDWLNVGDVTSYQASSLNLALGEDYFVSVRAVDRAGNRGDAVHSDGWIAGPYCQDKAAWITYNAFGAGTDADPYQICNPEQLANIGIQAAALSASYILMGDIDLAPYYAASNPEFQIGQCDQSDCSYWQAGTSAFEGKFDGNHRSIDNFSFVSPGTRGAGFIALAANNVAASPSEYTMKDLTLNNVSIAGLSQVGLIGRDSSHGRYFNVHVSGSVVGAGEHVAGLIGLTNASVVGNSSFQGTVLTSSGRFTGGLVGFMGHGQIYSSYSAGSVSGINDVGGLIGYISNNGILSNSHSSANVSGNSGVGGAAGLLNVHAQIRRSYATGDVSGASNIGGLLGAFDASVAGNSGIYDSYATGAVSFTVSHGGLLVGNGTATVSNSYSLSSSSCTGPSACHSVGLTHGNISDFFSPDNPPMSGWDQMSSLSDGHNDDWHFSGTDHAVLWHQHQPVGYGVPFSGSGTSGDPFVISNLAEFNLVGQNTRWMHAHFQLTQDLDFSASTFFQVGGMYALLTGSFDGGGNTISNVTNQQGSDSYVGVIGYIYGNVKNLTVSNVNIEGYNYVGGVVGSARAAHIENVHVASGTVTGHADDVGGVTGEVDAGLGISNSSSSAASVAGVDNVGGVVGRIHATTAIERSFSHSNVSGTNRVGGLIGNEELTNISDCYATGDVTAANQYAGGLIGRLSRDLVRSYATGNVSGQGYVGGLVGEKYGYTYYGIHDSFATGIVNGVNGSSVVGPIAGAINGSNFADNYHWSGASCDSTGSAGACNALGTGVASLADFHILTNAPMSAWTTSSIWVSGGSGAFPKLSWEP